MASLDRHFEKFHSQIALDVGRVERIKSAHQALRRYVDQDGPLAKVRTEVFLQGSYAQHTAIRPSQGGEFDVDVVLGIDAKDPADWLWDSNREPGKILEWLASRLRTVPAYSGKVRRRKRCVRIEYAGEFHMDVVPAHAPNGADAGVEVPDAGSSRWIRSHPKSYMLWCGKRNDFSDGRFSRVTKYLKWWRNNRVPTNARPKSIVLQTLIGTHVPGRALTDAEAVVRVLDQMSNQFGQHEFFFSTPEVRNPVQSEEDFAGAWDDSSAFSFGVHLRRAAERAKTAMSEPREARSAQLWQEVFGDAFPLGV